MSSFLIGFCVCAAAAIGFAALVFVVRRMDREDEIDFDVAEPDGFFAEEENR